MRRVVATATLLVSGFALLAACGEDDPAGGDQETKTIEITFEGDTVTPAGERVEVGVDQPVDLVVTADEPGEIHVHSEPEAELSYDAGTTTLELVIDKPGVVEVESHDLEKTIVQLQVG